MIGSLCKAAQLEKLTNKQLTSLADIPLYVSYLITQRLPDLW